MMTAENSTETSVSFYQTTRCTDPEDGHLHDNNIWSEVRVVWIFSNGSILHCLVTSSQNWNGNIARSLFVEISSVDAARTIERRSNTAKFKIGGRIVLKSNVRG
jgi:hypothetical protein